MPVGLRGKAEIHALQVRWKNARASDDYDEEERSYNRYIAACNEYEVCVEVDCWNDSPDDRFCTQHRF